MVESTPTGKKWFFYVQIHDKVFGNLPDAVSVNLAFITGMVPRETLNRHLKVRM